LDYSGSVIMKTGLEQLPPQETGRQTDFTNEKKFDSIAEAHLAFQGCFGKTLCNNEGEDVELMAEEGFFISIDLPAPGPDAGDGLEWVMVEELVSEGGANSAEEMCS